MNSRTLPLNPTTAPHAVWPGASGLFWVRAGALIVQAVLLWLAHRHPGEPVALTLLAASVAFGAAVMLIGLQQLRRRHPVGDAVVFRQILVDLGLLTVMLALAGGPDNPFHDAYFLPVAAAAMMLPARQTWTVVAASLGCYTAVHFVYLPLPGHPGNIVRLAEAGEWVTHGLLIAAAAFFLLRITQNLRSRERQLSQAREAAARAEYAIAVGTLAAGAAHELGTPLMTIAAVAEDLQADYGMQADLRSRLALLSAGIAECRATLDVLRQSGGGWAGAGAPMPLRALVDQIATRFRRMRPGAALEVQVAPASPEPTIAADLALQQAVINLLVEAAEASPGHVVLEVESTADELSIRVLDRRRGAAPQVTRPAGLDGADVRPLGLGLTLTQMTAQRLGGSFDIRQDARTGGTVTTQIVVPMASVRAQRS